MFKVAIVEDEKKAQEVLLDAVKRFGEEEKIEFEISRFPDAYAFLEKYTPFDLVFMDIEMPGLDGLKAAQRLREIDSFIQIVFVTNLASCAINGYEVSALDFIVKPIEYHSFYLKMKRIAKCLHATVEKKITIYKDKTILCYPLRDLLFVEVQGHILRYFFDGFDVETRGSISELEEKLTKDDFCRCNQCYLVNLRRVTAVKGLAVVVGKTELRMSRSKRDQFLGALSLHLGGTGV